MADRVSISFINYDGEQSVALFSHSGGLQFAEEARAYVSDLKIEKANRHSTPLDRLEPDTVMVDFIRHVTHSLGRVEMDLYLGATYLDGDNSDAGHHVIDVNATLRTRKRSLIWPPTV